MEKTASIYTGILHINGQLLLMLAAIMVLPGLVDLLDGSREWQAFILASAITAFFGGLLYLMTKGVPYRMDLRAGYLLTASSWLSVCLFSTLPMLFSDLDYGFIDYFFESVSGLTTTGSTVLSGLDEMARGMLLWRSLLQWFGGIGIVVLVMFLFPRMNIGGMQLFKSESSEILDKNVPRTSIFISRLFISYALLSVLCAFLYWLAGMSGFDALNHAMTTLSTAGFSTRDASMGYFDSALIEIICVVFMIMGALPLVFYAQMFFNFRIGGLFRSGQVQAFLSVWAFFVVLIGFWLWREDLYDIGTALRLSLFNVTSVVTTTGYATSDFAAWRGLAEFALIIMFFIGGCAGSTSGGVKIFRWQIMMRGTLARMKSALQPHRVIVEQYNGRRLSQEMIHDVRAFFFVYLLCWVMLTMILLFLDLDFMTSLSAAAQAIGNIGPGMGPTVGPAGNFAAFPDAGKWALIVGMLLGRLEIFTVLLLLLPDFWKK